MKNDEYIWAGNIVLLPAKAAKRGEIVFPKANFWYQNPAACVSLDGQDHWIDLASGNFVPASNIIEIPLNEIPKGKDFLLIIFQIKDLKQVTRRKKSWIRESKRREE